jgi:hypothetical protein
MALSQQTKERATKAVDEGNLFVLLAMIFKFGMELLEFISDRIQEKKAKNAKHDVPSNG